MKRSRVNEIMAEADAFIRSFGFLLPPFAYWTPDEFKRRGSAAAGIIDTHAHLLSELTYKEAAE